MIQHFWIAVDVFVIVATIITCFFMNKQCAWWLRVFLPFLLISIMIVHITHISGHVNFLLFPPLSMIFLK
ncbi:hypothetical protein RH08_00395 [Candidatus Liberibacter asiaticus]|uniref:Uncharacterized protein n=1 Tax=Liberibacter asiaticus (strain psy62) TaxID=537021 RepID=C6XHC8_LIBAP|nr:hypothetical protein CLIBASIA_00415 [Candidatus Liberibacter asiaticus str. psy62]ASK52318.1 hypothetical protein B2I23_00370 [Candidatus Liberibacter asiaticus]BAP25957.1 hypothetical protein CGUJ_00415 [Candidatus Liberibacter asiaticus str. Ishi-1]AWL13640.1 hypothetical protein DIC79_00385 [Candidatus Liberibacter asiaticus]KIH95420.1 hypothetical protein RH08_00395 [Candidatus Liberibacter asiaticus]